MRWWIASLAALLGCAPRMPSPPSPPALAVEVDHSEFAAKVAGLRATLARHGVEIDTGPPVIDSCEPEPTGALKKGCSRCVVATRANTAGMDLEEIDAVSIAFGAYPPAFFQAAKLEHIALCRTLQLATDDPELDAAGVAIPAQHRLLISVERFVADARGSQSFGLMEVVHHELFHLFDEATEPEAFRSRDPMWHAMNPRGFAYHDPAPVAGVRPAGFVNQYATTNEREDRASVFELLLGRPDTLCEIARQDPVVAEKVTAVWKRVAKVTGEKLLHQQAPCVDWTSGRKPAPRPAKKSPKRTGPVNLRIDRR